MNSQLLHTEAAQYRALSDQLKTDYASLDDETLTDTLEGLSDPPAMIEEIIRSALEDEAMVAGLKLRADAMAERLSRLKERHHKKRQLAAWALRAAGLAKLKAVDFTVSLSECALRLEISDESKIPQHYLIPQPAKPDRAGITNALKEGRLLEGARLVQGQPYITVSTR
jgi:hypothetical protein